MDIERESVYATLDNVNSSLRNLCEITSRVDERIKSLEYRLTDQDKRYSMTVDQMQGMQNRIIVLESKTDVMIRQDLDFARDKITLQEHRISMLEFRHGGADEKWKRLVAFACQLVTGVVSAFLLWKLGLKE